MPSHAFLEIAAGLKDAIAHAKGDQGAARVHTIPVVDVKQVRERLQMSQREFAEAVMVSLDTLQNWEQHRRTPHGPALVLLNVLDQHPEVVFQTMKNRRAASRT